MVICLRRVKVFNREPLTVTRYSHYFTVTGMDARASVAIRKFALLLTSFKLEGSGTDMRRVADKSYLTSSQDKKTVRLTISLLSHFTQFMAQEGIRVAISEPMPIPACVSIDVGMNPKFVSRDYQVPIIDFFTKKDDPPEMKDFGYKRVGEVQMGKGKTYMALKSIEILKRRTMIILKPMYISKWIDDVLDAFKNYKGAKWRTGDLVVVQGSAQLAGLIDDAKRGKLKAKIIIMSNRTLANYIIDYKADEELADDVFGCRPENLFELLGVGFKVTDEVHQDFYINFIVDLFTNLDSSLDLSATLEPSDPFMKKMYRIHMPLETRYSKLAYDQYIGVTSLMYTIKDIRRFKCTQRGMYNHPTFEKSIRRDYKLYKGYKELIKWAVRFKFIENYKPGIKCLIFFGLVDMCSDMQKAIQEWFPDMKVGLYVAGSSRDVLKESDIIVSTLKSCGTAIDIKNLAVTIMTDAIDTQQGNEQAMGRLRPIELYPDMTPMFYYFCCQTIGKHLAYHRNKFRFFTGKAKVLRIEQTGFNL